MRRACVLLLTSVFATAGGASAFAEPLTEHKSQASQDILWKPAPPTFPPGSETAMLFGDPAKEGPFVVRVEEDAVVQINDVGPRRIDYVDPRDYPRKKSE